jgi:hypothetical protein
LDARIDECLRYCAAMPGEKYQLAHGLGREKLAEIIKADGGTSFTAAVRAVRKFLTQLQRDVRQGLVPPPAPASSAAPPAAAPPSAAPPASSTPAALAWLTPELSALLASKGVVGLIVGVGAHDLRA